MCYYGYVYTPKSRHSVCSNLTTFAASESTIFCFAHDQRSALLVQLQDLSLSFPWRLRNCGMRMLTKKSSFNVYYSTVLTVNQINLYKAQKDKIILSSISDADYLRNPRTRFIRIICKCHCTDTTSYNV